jgi:hypothetical protein
VLDANGDGVFNVEPDLTCKFVVGIQNVIPEVPFGTANSFAEHDRCGSWLSWL